MLLKAILAGVSAVYGDDGYFPESVEMKQTQGAMDSNGTEVRTDRTELSPSVTKTNKCAVSKAAC